MSGRRLYSITWAGSSARESDGLLTRRSGVQIPPGPLSRGTDVTSGAAPDLNQTAGERSEADDEAQIPPGPYREPPSTGLTCTTPVGPRRPLRVAGQTRIYAVTGDAT